MMRLVWLIAAALALTAVTTATAQTSRVPSRESIRDVATTPHAKIARAALTAKETQATIDFEVVLKMRNFAELQARVGRYERIARTEMAGKYHPLVGDYASVVAWLKGEGLTITSEDASHLAIFGRGTVAQVSRAFQTTFARISFAGRETTSAVTAPSLPAALSGVVLGINGLQPHLAPQKHSRQLGPRPLSTTGNGPPFLPSQIAKAYNGSSVTADRRGADHRHRHRHLPVEQRSHVLLEHLRGESIAEQYPGDTSRAGPLARAFRRRDARCGMEQFHGAGRQGARLCHD